MARNGHIEETLEHWYTRSDAVIANNIVGNVSNVFNRLDYLYKNNK